METKSGLQKALPWLLLIAGVIGLYCAFVLSQDRITLLEHPQAHLGCSIDPIIACGNVVGSDQGHAFGFPNPFLGLTGFAALAIIGLVLLAGAQLKRWFWLALQAGLLFAVSFVHWLFFESVYRIHALCIYCMTVWLITIISFWYVTLYNADQRHLAIPSGKAQTVYRWLRRHHLDLVVLWLLSLAALILKHFWYYYGKHLPF